MATGNNDIEPFIIAMKDGKPLCIKCEIDENGCIILPAQPIALSQSQLRKKII